MMARTGRPLGQTTPHPCDRVALRGRADFYGADARAGTRHPVR